MLSMLTTLLSKITSGMVWMLHFHPKSNPLIAGQKRCAESIWQAVLVEGVLHGFISFKPLLANT
jgi:hypothetical protein